MLGLGRERGIGRVAAAQFGAFGRRGAAAAYDAHGAALGEQLAREARSDLSGSEDDVQRLRVHGSGLPVSWGDGPAG